MTSLHDLYLGAHRLHSFNMFFSPFWRGPADIAPIPTTEGNPTLLYMPAEVMLRARADPGFLLKWNSTKVRGVNDGLVAYSLSP